VNRVSKLQCFIIYYSLQSVTHPTIAEVRELWLIYHRAMVPVNQPSEQCLERLEEAIFQVSEQLASMGTCRSKPARCFRCGRPKHLVCNWRSMPAQDTLSAPFSDMPQLHAWYRWGTNYLERGIQWWNRIPLSNSTRGCHNLWGNIAWGCHKTRQIPHDTWNPQLKWGW